MPDMPSRWILHTVDQTDMDTNRISNEEHKKNNHHKFSKDLNCGKRQALISNEHLSLENKIEYDSPTEDTAMPSLVSNGGNTMLSMQGLSISSDANGEDTEFESPWQPIFQASVSHMLAPSTSDVCAKAGATMHGDILQASSYQSSLIPSCLTLQQQGQDVHQDGGSSTASVTPRESKKVGLSTAESSPTVWLAPGRLMSLPLHDSQQLKGFKRPGERFGCCKSISGLGPNKPAKDSCDCKPFADAPHVPLYGRQRIGSTALGTSVAIHEHIGQYHKMRNVACKPHRQRARFRATTHTTAMISCAQQHTSAKQGPNLHPSLGVQCADIDLHSQLPNKNTGCTLDTSECPYESNHNGDCGHADNGSGKQGIHPPGPVGESRKSGRLTNARKSDGNGNHGPTSAQESVPKQPSAWLPPLTFAASFESANLRAAVRIGACEYDLFMAPDLNDVSDFGLRCQWFFFAITGAQPGLEYRFNICNFNKKESLFNCGVQPLVACVSKPEPPSVADECSPDVWKRTGSNIVYYPSPYRAPPRPKTAQARTTSLTPGDQHATSKPPGMEPSIEKLWKALGPKADAAGKGLYALSFTTQFPSADQYFLASCFPYTYTDLQSFLLKEAWMEGASGLDFAGSSTTRRSLLCHTVGGNRCDLLTITDFESSAAEIAEREVVVFTARVHPGESNASWVMQVHPTYLLCSAQSCTLFADCHDTPLKLPTQL
jgi:hypothetical protein